LPKPPALPCEFCPARLKTGKTRACAAVNPGSRIVLKVSSEYAVDDAALKTIAETVKEELHDKDAHVVVILGGALNAGAGITKSLIATDSKRERILHDYQDALELIEKGGPRRKKEGGLLEDHHVRAYWSVYRKGQPVVFNKMQHALDEHGGGLKAELIKIADPQHPNTEEQATNTFKKINRTLERRSAEGTILVGNGLPLGDNDPIAQEVGRHINADFVIYLSRGEPGVMARPGGMQYQFIEGALPVATRFGKKSGTVGGPGSKAEIAIEYSAERPTIQCKIEGLRQAIRGLHNLKTGSVYCIDRVRRQATPRKL